MRLQQTAGGGSGSDRLRTVNALSAAFLHRDPSFNRLLAAHKSYRMALESGRVIINPRDAYAVDKCFWLWQEAAE